MRSRQQRPVNIPNQGRIGADVYDTTKNPQIALSRFIYSAYKASSLKARKAIDKISPVKAFP